VKLGREERRGEERRGREGDGIGHRRENVTRVIGNF